MHAHAQLCSGFQQEIPLNECIADLSVLICLYVATKYPCCVDYAMLL